MVSAAILLMSAASAAASPSDVCSFARQQLLSALADRKGRVEAAAISKPCEVSLPEGAVKLASRFAATRVRPRMIVWVDVRVNGRLQQSVPVTLDVHWYRAALVARESLAAKVPLSADRFSLEEVDAAATRGEPLMAAQLQGMRLRRELEAGAVLGSEDVESQPDVIAGEKVDVYAAAGRVVVRTVGIAQRDGFAGDPINARLEKANESVRVRVIGKNRAQVIENENAF